MPGPDADQMPAGGCLPDLTDTAAGIPAESRAVSQTPRPARRRRRMLVPNLYCSYRQRKQRHSLPEPDYENVAVDAIESADNIAGSLAGCLAGLVVGLQERLAQQVRRVDAKPDQSCSILCRNSSSSSRASSDGLEVTT